MASEETELREVVTVNKHDAIENIRETEDQGKKEKKRKLKNKVRKHQETDLNNVSEKKDNGFNKSDTENEDRIKNDISDRPTKEKNTNIAKEHRRKKGVEKEKRKRKEERKQKSIEKSEELDPNISRTESNNVIGVFIHECEVLELDFLVCHPVVKISIVDGSTGQLLAKSVPDRRVTSFYESEKVTKILPLMTQPFDFKQKQSIVPKWEELLLFNDNFDETFEAEKNKNVVMFFEVLDFLPMTVASKNFRHYGQSGGWYRIAWAFLKLVDQDWRSSRFGSRCRLQLYKPSVKMSSSREEETNIRDVWSCWRSDRRRYPATLWVTVEPVTPPTSSEPTLRSMLATQPEQGQQVGPVDTAVTNEQEEQQSLVVWSRLPGQSCKVPSTLSLRLDTATRGVSALAFSSDGRRLAVASVNQTTSTIRIYDFPSGIFLTSLSELYGMVYELCFHSDGVMLAAVGDGSSIIWSSNSWKLEEKLKHPSYVYTAQFHPATSSVVATGGFDRVVRIWRQDQAGYRVSQELTGHSQHINCLKFDIEGHFLFSGDNKGLIKMWESPESHGNHGLESSTDSFSHFKNKTWSFKREFRVSGEAGSDSPVCKLAPHPGGRRLLVHVLHPSFPLSMLDLRTGGVMQTYPDIENFRLPAASCISPCGSWVVGGSDCGAGICWNTDTGEKVHIFREMIYDKQISAIAFHPHEHALVLGSVETNSKVRVLKCQYVKLLTPLYRWEFIFMTRK